MKNVAKFVNNANGTVTAYEEEQGTVYCCEMDNHAVKDVIVYLLVSMIRSIYTVWPHTYVKMEENHSKWITTSILRENRGIKE